MKRIERFSPEKRKIVEVRIDDFKIGSGPAWSEISNDQDLNAIKNEMRFFNNAGVLAGRDDVDKRARSRLSAAQYMNYKSKPTAPASVVLIHVCPKAAEGKLSFSMLKDESGHYVWY